MAGQCLNVSDPATWTAQNVIEAVKAPRDPSPPFLRTVFGWNEEQYKQAMKVCLIELERQRIKTTAGLPPTKKDGKIPPKRVSAEAAIATAAPDLFLPDHLRDLAQRPSWCTPGLMAMDRRDPYAAYPFTTLVQLCIKAAKSQKGRESKQTEIREETDPALSSPPNRDSSPLTKRRRSTLASYSPSRASTPQNVRKQLKHTNFNHSLYGPDHGAHSDQEEVVLEAPSLLNIARKDLEVRFAIMYVKADNLEVEVVPRALSEIASKNNPEAVEIGKAKSGLRDLKKNVYQLLYLRNGHFWYIPEDADFRAAICYLHNNACNQGGVDIFVASRDTQADLLPLRYRGESWLVSY